MTTRGTESPVRVSNLLVAAVPGLRERLIEQSLRANWARIVGREWSLRSRPAGLKSGTLDIVVDNSPLLHEMKLRSSELLAAVQAVRPGSVSALRLHLGPRPADRAPGSPARSPSPPPLAADELTWIDSAVASVSDATLESSLRRLLTKDLLSHRSRGRRREPPASPLHKDTT